MAISSFIEKYFWVLLLAGIGLGLWAAAPFTTPAYVQKILLGLMLFTVFLKIDALEVLENMRNYKLMIYISVFYMIIIPLLFYFSFSVFDQELATAILLLTAMPAGVSTPALTDILKGNASMSMSLAIITQLAAPFTVPLLFWLVNIHGLSINKMLILKDIAVLVFVPVIISQVIKRWFGPLVKKATHFLTSANIILLFAFVYLTIASRRNVILENPAGLIIKILILYFVFILLHIIGYLICFREKKENRIAVAIGSAYMNNGMAIVLAVAYFKPEIVIFLVLSEIPWNTLLAPFRKIASSL